MSFPNGLANVAGGFWLCLILTRSSENVQLLQTDTISDDLLFIMVKIHMDYDKLV